MLAFWSPDGLRKSRLHDEKGNLADPGWLGPALFAFVTAAAKRLFGWRLRRPMISIRATSVLEAHLRPDSNVVEFGSGMSTPWLAARCGSLLSIEDHAGWAERVRAMLAECKASHVRHELRDDDAYADLAAIPDGFFHLALIDGSQRGNCARNVLSKMAVGGLIYLDNSDKDMTRPGGDLRLAEEILIQAARSHNWPFRYFTDFSPTNFFAEQGMLIEVASPYRAEPSQQEGE